MVSVLLTWLCPYPTLVDVLRCFQHEGDHGETREGLGAALGLGRCGRAGAEPRCSSSPVQTTGPPRLPWCLVAVHKGRRAAGPGRVQVRGSYGAVTRPSVLQQ